MFCNQCEQTAKGTGCTVRGVCGKQPEVAALQDLLMHALKGIALVAQEGRRVGVVDVQVNRFTTEAMFSTLTNVNFDPERFASLIREAVEQNARLKNIVAGAGGTIGFTDPAATFTPAAKLEDLIRQGVKIGPPWDDNAPQDICSLQQTMLFGLKGVAAYAHHAAVLNQEDDKVYAFIHEGLVSLTRKTRFTLDEWINLTLKVGEVNLRAMELLDAGNTGLYGHPVPTEVPLGHKKGKCLLVSGHDLKDLQAILEQSTGQGITVYSHGEMLPTHGYPELKKHKHFYGHYGTAWQNQKKEFARFPGSIIMTTNCIQEPRESYLSTIFTTAMVGWPGATHLQNGDFRPAIAQAQAMPGFDTDEDNGSVTVGFARNTVMSVAGKVIDAVKGGAISHIFLVGGCDGARTERSYYTEFVEKIPADTVVLTLACGKFRFFDKKLGDIGGIPRLLDVGQCNDAYSAIQIAVALADAFKCGVNDLPLTLVLSWYEQKACAILLTLLHLGIKNIYLGPSLPAFISPNVLEVLVKTFDLKPISTPDADLKAILKK
ncbi:MAG TPA: hydroxylamine reductase [Candidatus Limnocylindrales bacterium]|nr:hydroxylamine reductase [Candidatus Limnocylindrales bacterium]